MEIGPFPPGKRGRTGRSSEGLSSRDHSVTLTKKGGAGKSGMEQNASVSRRKLCHGKSTYRVSSSLLHCSAISFACSITSSCKKKRGDFCRKPPRIQEESSVQLDTLAEWSPVTQADKNSPRPNRWVGCDSTEWTPPPLPDWRGAQPGGSLVRRQLQSMRRPDDRELLSLAVPNVQAPLKFFRNLRFISCT